ncbi:Hpt domain-containing protein [Dongia soli]|uniref:Hpt domain-containing protein n=1 Tax=Dongia soli TaxID=600628 RepID=A0ABU5E8Z6_9PROT|nr:Hpt domain-containing protein [Dongia soli]MDY0882514.1 Hpt domain-containing protein [Dongia soli]
MLDRRVIEQLIDDIGQDVFGRLSRQFLDETTERIAAIKACRQGAEWKELARHAHSLKSTSQSFGLQQTGQLAAALQHAGDREQVALIEQLSPDLFAAATVECREFAELCDQLAFSSQ